MREISHRTKKKIWVGGIRLLLLLSIIIGTLLVNTNRKSYADTVPDMTPLTNFLVANHLAKVQQDFGPLLHPTDTSATAYRTLLGSGTIVDRLFATNGHDYWAAVRLVERQYLGLPTEFPDLNKAAGALATDENIIRIGFSFTSQRSQDIHNPYDNAIDHMFTAVIESQPPPASGRAPQNSASGLEPNSLNDK